MSIKKQIERFWKVFVKEQINLEKALKSNNQDEVNEIVKILSAYFEELCNCTLEVEVNDDFFEITFYSDLDKNCEYICALMKKMAPKVVSDHWIINAFLPPLSEKAMNTIIKVKNQDYTYKDFSVYYQIDEINRLFNVDVYSSAFNDLEPNKALELSMYLIKMFVGETEYEARINHINAINEMSEYEDVCKLDEFYEIICETIEKNKWVEYHDPCEIYMVYHLEEDRISDNVREDMELVFTSNPHMIAETLNGDGFIANSFSDLGGEFGYLYYKHDQNKNSAIKRQQYEKAISKILYDSNIARSVGGAIGTKYAYIDLAIFDKELFILALDKINEKLKMNFKYVKFE